MIRSILYFDHRSEFVLIKLNYIAVSIYLYNYLSIYLSIYVYICIQLNKETFYKLGNQVFFSLKRKSVSLYQVIRVIVYRLRSIEMQIILIIK